VCGGGGGGGGLFCHVPLLWAQKHASVMWEYSDAQKGGTTLVQFKEYMVHIRGDVIVVLVSIHMG